MKSVGKVEMILRQPFNLSEDVKVEPTIKLIVSDVLETRPQNETKIEYEYR